MVNRNEIIDHILRCSSLFKRSGKTKEDIRNILNELDCIDNLLSKSGSIDDNFIIDSKAEVAFQKGKCYHMLSSSGPENLDRALDQWRKVIELKPDHEARKFLDKFGTEEYAQKALLGNLITEIAKALDDENWNKAASLAQEAINKDPQNPTPHVYLCTARLALAGRAEKDYFLAILQEVDHAEGLLSIIPLDENKADRAQIEFIRGSCHLALSDWDPSEKEKGIQHLRKALEMEPDHWYAKEALSKFGGQKSGCFVATAAFGTPLAEEVIILSNFRDEYLSRKVWGRKFISFYYHISPSLAFLITGKKALCWLVRSIIIFQIVKLIKKCKE